MYIDSKMILSRPLIPQLMCIVLVLLIVMQVVQGILSLRQNSASLRIVTNELPDRHKDHRATEQLNVPLFGEYVPETIADNNVKKSMLNMTVVGIMFDSKDKTSHVIIRDANNLQRLYKVGDTLTGNAVIKRITADGVLISRDGLLESLRLSQHKLKFAPPPEPLN